jgi:hypothetical protein
VTRKIVFDPAIVRAPLAQLLERASGHAERLQSSRTRGLVPCILRLSIRIAVSFAPPVGSGFMHQIEAAPFVKYDIADVAGCIDCNSKISLVTE